MILFFDTETTGFIDFKAPLSAPHQPHLVQLGMILCGNSSRVIKEYSAIVRPDGWIIPPDMVHGISQEQALRDGLHLTTVLDDFVEWIENVDTLVAHNLVFDKAVLQANFLHVGRYFNTYTSTFCTMLNTTNICKLPKKKGSGFKWPKLEEAYAHFFPSKKMEKAHDALSDCRATMEIYFKLKGISPLGAPRSGECEGRVKQVCEDKEQAVFASKEAIELLNNKVAGPALPSVFPSQKEGQKMVASMKSFEKTETGWKENPCFKAGPALTTKEKEEPNSLPESFPDEQDKPIVS